jgi:hypothetical protein
MYVRIVGVGNLSGENCADFLSGVVCMFNARRVIDVHGALVYNVRVTPHVCRVRLLYARGETVCVGIVRRFTFPLFSEHPKHR